MAVQSYPLQTAPRSDMVSRFSMLAIFGLLIFMAIFPPTVPAAAEQQIIIAATPTPAAQPALEIAAPTAPPEALPAALQSTEAPPPVVPVAMPPIVPVAPSYEAAPVPPASAEYLAVIGEQAPHSPRGNTNEPPLSQTGPILVPGNPDYIIAPARPEAPAHVEAPAPIAVALPPITEEQKDVLADRTSNTCAPGEVFYPRTGCHTPGSAGPMPGAVSE